MYLFNCTFPPIIFVINIGAAGFFVYPPSVAADAAARVAENMSNLMVALGEIDLWVNGVFV